MGRDGYAETRLDPPPGGMGGGETILLVADDVLLRADVVRMLDLHGYNLITAESGEDALELSRVAPGTVDLLITDLIMPGINGCEAAEGFLEHDPHAQILYMAGYTDDAGARAGRRFPPNFAFIQKPFTGEELTRHVCDLLDSAVPTGAGSSSDHCAASA